MAIQEYLGAKSIEYAKLDRNHKLDPMVILYSYLQNDTANTANRYKRYHNFWTQDEKKFNMSGVWKTSSLLNQASMSPTRIFKGTLNSPKNECLTINPKARTSKLNPITL